MVTQRLSAEVTIGADGSGSVSFGPVPNLTAWSVSSISVTVTGTTVGARASVHVGDTPSDANFIEGTETGERDASFYPSGTLVLLQGDRLHVLWTGAEVGDQARATVRLTAGQG